jgi:hypothetical protein
VSCHSGVAFFEAQFGGSLRELLDFRRENISFQKLSFPHLCRLAGHIFSFHYLALS